MVNDLDAAGNIFLGREPVRRLLGHAAAAGSIDRCAERSADLLRRVRIELRLPTTGPFGSFPVDNAKPRLSAVSFCRNRARLVIMDEPTAALGVREQRKVLDLIRSLSEHGMAVMIISHNLEHVFTVSQRVIVLRGGMVAGVVATSEVEKAGRGEPDHGRERLT